MNEPTEMKNRALLAVWADEKARYGKFAPTGEVESIERIHGLHDLPPLGECDLSEAIADAVRQLYQFFYDTLFPSDALTWTEFREVESALADSGELEGRVSIQYAPRANGSTRPMTFPVQKDDAQSVIDAFLLRAEEEGASFFRPGELYDPRRGGAYYYVFVYDEAPHTQMG